MEQYWATEYLRTKTATWAGRNLPPLMLAGGIPGLAATSLGYPAGLSQGIQQARAAGTPIDPDTIETAGLGHGLAQVARAALPVFGGAMLGGMTDLDHGAQIGGLTGAVAAAPWLYGASKNRALDDVQRAVDVNESQRARVNVVNNMPPQMTPEQLAAFHQELLTRMGQSRDPDLATYHAMMAENPDMGRVQTVDQSPPDYSAKLRAMMA